MASMKWTAAQEDALSFRGGNLLLSAAAGSGKTAVLVERLIQRITDPNDPVAVNEFLVLTFTRSAAAEMRSRIGAALTQRLQKEGTIWQDHPTDAGSQRMAYLERQIALLGSASISTIDAFCQSVLRQYFYLLDLDPDFRILSDENEKYLLQDDVLSEVLLRWYDKNDASFRDLVDLFASNYQDTKLRDTILRLYGFSRSLAFPEDFLRRLPEPYDCGGAKTPDGFPWVRNLLQTFREKAESWRMQYLRMVALVDEEEALVPYSEQLSEEYAACSLLLEPDSQNWDSWYRVMNRDLFQRLKSVSKKQAQDPAQFDARKAEIQDLRNGVKKEYQDIQKQYFSVSPMQWVSDMEAARPLVTVLSQLVLDFSAAYEERKKKEGLLEFNDMEHQVLRLLLAPGSTPDHLVRSDAALALQKKYKEVMVDEYQDTNSLQELITVLISTDTNRFLVGDIKQSIYRFRQADPTIFLEKYNTFAAGSESSRRIDLNQNFRSDPAVLSAANFIFRQIFRTEDNGEAVLSLSYTDAEALYAGRNNDEAPAGYVGGSVNIELLDTKAGEEENSDNQDVDKMDLEARLIASKIQALMDGTHLVMEKDGTYRPIAYKDIVILLRAVETKASILMKTLQSQNIPALCDQKDDFFAAPEVQILWAILKILDNPQQDLALTAVLRSPIVMLTEESLAALRLTDRDSLWNALSNASSLLSPEQAVRAVHFRSACQKWRRLSRKTGVAPLIETILNDTDYLSYFSGTEGSAFRRAHILSFYETARSWDLQSMSGLYRFLCNLESAEKNGRAFQQGAAAHAESNAVRIMTIHKSKGLEFPVVFLASAGTKFNMRDSQSLAVWDKENGLGLARFDRDHLCCWPTLYSYAIKNDIRRETIAEEARLLYVAMTRARDALIITGSIKDSDATLRGWTRGLEGSDDLPIPPLPAYRITGATSYLDWLLPAALRSRSLSNVWEREAAGIPAFVKGDAHFTCTFHDRAEFLTGEEQQTRQKDMSPHAISNFLKETGPFPKWLDQQFSWTYPHEGAVLAPAKLTATAAVRLAEADKEEVMPSVLLTQPITEKSPLPPDFAEPPAFLSLSEDQYSGTSYGTLMHKAMEKLDFQTLSPGEDAVTLAIRALGESHQFTEEELKVLLSSRRGRRPVRDILRFMESPLGTLMKRAHTIRKEMPFSILLPAQEFYKDCSPDETIFLQGAIDCLLEKDGKLVIIDYKTDRVESGEVLAAHYQRQLQIYGKSAQKILGKPVVALYLWSFHLKEAVRVHME